MNLIFSICSNNYLAQAAVQWKSVRKFLPDTPYLLFLCDQKLPSIDYSKIAGEVIELESIEPRFVEMSLKYNIVELNTCLKPRIFEYLFTEREIHHAIFLDPDIKLFHSLAHLFKNLETANILLTPHIYTPIPMDGKKPAEENFLMFGIYNLGFIGVSHTMESIKFLNWWKTKTYEMGFMDTYKGIFVDQLPVNQVPIFFKSVEILQDMGLNMAPWNLHERWLENRDGQIFVNQEEPLKFYHFSAFIAGQVELPRKYYNRYLLKDRPDLQQIYEEYNVELLAAGYPDFHRLENAYSGPRKQYLRKLKKEKLIRKFLP